MSTTLSLNLWLPFWNLLQQIWKPQPTPNRDKLRQFLYDVIAVAHEYEQNKVAAFPEATQQARAMSNLLFERKAGEITRGNVLDLLEQTQPESGGINASICVGKLRLTSYGKTIVL